MVVTTLCATVSGIEAVPVHVQVKAGDGKSSFVIIGLGDTAVREARDRVSSALAQLGVRRPSRILVNLAPAEVKKEGAAFDLAIAIAILAAQGVVPREALSGRAFYAELALDGALKGVRGVLPCALLFQSRKERELVVAESNYAEARLLSGLTVRSFARLGQIVQWLKGGPLPVAPSASPVPVEAGRSQTFGQVWGQAIAKRALTIAAAGGHHVLMVGPPGCGKSMLARRIGSILPTLAPQEQHEVAQLHSVAGLSIDSILSGTRPFRAPHHSVSEVGLIGGGSNPRPGEISLAHRGVLFLDEFPEFRRVALEALRAPLEDGIVTIARARGRLTIPARFQLIAAMNPCPCGRLGATVRSNSKSCLCSRSAVESYLRKLSQPILDRIDLQVEMEQVAAKEMLIGEVSNREEASYADDNDRVLMVQRARELQYERQGALNSCLSVEEIRHQARLEARACALIERGVESLELSARGFLRVLRVSATIADIESSKAITAVHVAEALRYRALAVLERYIKGNTHAYGSTAVS